jgi:hypothetical protein
MVGSVGSMAVVRAVKYTISRLVIPYREAKIATIIALLPALASTTMQSTKTAKLNSEAMYEIT